MPHDLMIAAMPLRVSRWVKGPIDGNPRFSIRDAPPGQDPRRRARADHAGGERPVGKILPPDRPGEGGTASQWAAEPLQQPGGVGKVAFKGCGTAGEPTSWASSDLCQK